jgi:hypothetical protein
VALVTNNFEGGTATSTITTAGSGAASGTAFDVVTIGTGAAVTWDSTHSAHGALSAKMSTGTTASGADVEWTTSVGAQGTIYGRFYLYVTANPTASQRVMTTATSGGATLCSGIYLMTDGTLLMTDAATSTILQTTNSVNLNGWTRVEFKVIGSATVGHIELGIYKTMDSSTATESLSSSSILNTGGTIALYSIGSGADVKANQVAVWFDDVGFSTTGYLGSTFVGGSTFPGAWPGTYAPQFAAAHLNVLLPNFWTHDRTGPFVGITSSDAGSSVEGTSQAVSLSSSDTGSGFESGPGLVYLGATTFPGSALYLGSGIQTTPTYVAASYPDVGSGTEISSIAATTSAPDTGSGAETGSVGITVTDTGAGTELAAVAATATAADTGGSSDLGAVEVLSADAGTGADVAVLALSSADGGLSTDMSVLAATTAQSDIAAGLDGQSVSTLLSANDTGSAAEGQSTNVTVTADDLGSAVDVAGVASLEVRTSDAVQSSEATIVSIVDGDVGQYIDLAAASLAPPGPTSFELESPTVVQVLRQVTTRANGSMSIAWVPISQLVGGELYGLTPRRPYGDILDGGQLAVRLDLHFVRPGTVAQPPLAAGFMPDRTGVMFADVSAAGILKAGDRVQCVSGPIDGIFEIRVIPDTPADYSKAHHLEVEVIEVSQHNADGSYFSPDIDSLSFHSFMRNLYDLRVAVLRRATVSESGGSAREVWNQIADIPDVMWDTPGEMWCRLSLRLVRRHKDALPPLVAGRAPDRFGVLYCDVTPFLRAGDRVVCLEGPIAGTFELRVAPDLSPNLTTIHHLEVQVIEVAQSLAGIFPRPEVGA